MKKIILIEISFKDLVDKFQLPDKNFLVKMDYDGDLQVIGTRDTLLKYPNPILEISYEDK